MVMEVQYGQVAGMHLNNLIIKNNTHTLQSSGIVFLRGGENSPRLTNSLVINNTGTGVVCVGGLIKLSNVTIANNTMAGIALFAQFIKCTSNAD